MHRWLDACGKQGQGAVFHNHSLWMMPNVYPGQCARRWSIPYVVSPRGTLGPAAFKGGSRLKSAFWTLLQRPSLAAVTCFHATATSEAAEVRSHGFRQPIAVIPNGIDMPEPEFLRTHRAREVLFLGRIHPKKGIDMLLRSWQTLESAFDDWTLRIVGPDNRGHMAEMRSLCGTLGLRRVLFEGELTGDRRLQAYRRASLFVLPTRNENFAMTVAESLAAGTPVVVTKGAPWSGVLEHRCGWWTDIDHESLAAGLAQAMSMPAGTLAEMGANGQAWMASEFSWPEIGDRMLGLYRWLLAGARHDERPEFVSLD
jgi:glycosyltransferase involved in cell wall biosynthesis